MTAPLKSASSVKPVFLTLAVLFSALVFSLILRKILWDPIQFPFINGTLISALVLGLVSFRPVARFLSRLPRPHALVFAAFLFLFIAAQLIGRSRTMFPFSSWSMFTETIRDETVKYHQFIGRTEQGKEVYLRPARWISVVRDGRIINRFEQLSRGITLPEKIDEKTPETESAHSPHRKITDAIRDAFHDPASGSARRSPQELTSWLDALAGFYNRKHPDDPVRSIEVVRVTDYFLEPYPFRKEKETVFRFDLVTGDPS